jgi:uncharacterized short protein YbdD (DUF466 family)
MSGEAGNAGAGSAPTANARAAALRWIAAGWSYLRTVSGDDAYERYLAHHSAAHSGEALMSRKDYFTEMQRRKWSGVSRCC